MLPAQIIQQKRDGRALSEEEIRFFIDGFTRGAIPDYQMAALAMAICFQGLSFDETLFLTRAMVESGTVIQWRRSNTPSIHHSNTPFFCDKHSTGGIGDKTSLLIAPLVAACGVKVPMISGRGLGPTGGTLDKLESIPGFRTNLTLDELVRVTDEVGCCITGATPDIAPADKKLYALRDVTATVSCLPLIVASIMSKKLAANVDGLVLDVKWGRGAFMRTREASRELAEVMVAVGKRYGKQVVALQTDMNQPLGSAIGNALEVRECVEILRNPELPDRLHVHTLERSHVGAGERSNVSTFPPANASADLLEVSLALAAEMLLLAGTAKDVAAAREMLHKKLADGSALEKFRAMVRAQGGDPAVGEDPKRLLRAGQIRPVPSLRSGYVQAIAGDQIGYAVIALGGGRKVASDRIDLAVGFDQPRKIGEPVRAGEPLLQMHYNDSAHGADAERMIQAAYTIGDERVAGPPLIVATIR